MTQKQSIHKTIYSIFTENPYHVYTTRDLLNIFSNTYSLKIEKKTITQILTRLLRKKLIQRTSVQLADGYYYSLKNKDLLNRIYENHLLPYNFDNREELINKIVTKKFNSLDSNKILDLENLRDSKFIQKYYNDKLNSKIKIFIALITGFLMCDGTINKNSNGIQFFLRRKSDAELFVKDFKEIFGLEELTIKIGSQGGCYVVRLLGASSAAKLFHSLGVPKGNKVFQPFLTPDWIYHGSNEIKKIFLSTIIGNEGSAPSNGKWRIQFVLSKCKEHVPNLIEFLNQIRSMLYHFGITTSHIQVRKQKGRQFYGRFYIKGEENLQKFYKQFSFLYASEKQEVLEELISRGRSRTVKNVMN